MSKRSLAWLFGLGAIPPAYLFLARYLAGGTGSDFWAMHDAGRAILSGAPVYGARTIFPYPPHSLFLFVPLSVPPFQIGLLAFSVFGLGLFLWAARPHLDNGFPPIFAVFTPAALFCLYYGQTGLIVGGLWLLAFRGGWPAVALLTIKPHLGFLSILSLRNASTFVKTSLLALALIAASMLVFGYGLWLDFFAALRSQADLIGTRPNWASIGISPAMTFGRGGWLIFAFAAAWLLSQRITPFTAATAALLISPYAFLYDMPVASLGFALSVHRDWEKLRFVDRLVLISAFVSPCYVFFLPWAVPPVLLCALWTQVRRIPIHRNSDDFRELHGDR